MRLFKYLLRKIRVLVLGIEANKFHPMVWILGKPEIGAGVYIGGFSEVNAAHSHIFIGDNCDIASFVAINTADSHKKTLGLAAAVERRPIWIGKSVFIGSHSVIKGGAVIGDFSVIAAGTIVEGTVIPAYSLVSGNPMLVRAGYYASGLKHEDSSQ